MDVDECIQIDMAEDIRILFGKDLTVEIESASMQPFSSYIPILNAEEDTKVLCQLLNKLYIPDVVDDHKIRSLKLLMDNLRAFTLQSIKGCHESRFVLTASPSAGFSL